MRRWYWLVFWRLFANAPYLYLEFAWHGRGAHRYIPSPIQISGSPMTPASCILSLSSSEVSMA